jgi:radical SAM protein with 4Fe4S-binding SPASM domain
MSGVFEAFDKTRDLEDKPFNSLCYAPDLQLSFSPNGDATACCISRSNVLGNVRTERLDDIWHGQRLRKFREMLRGYVFPPGCESCKWSLEAGNYLGHPIRRYDFAKFRRDGIAVEESERWPAKLEFALSNKCNLGCIMCDGKFSSVLRAKEGLPPLRPAYGDDFFEDLARYLPHARTLAFLGGEPFLQKECYRIWEMLIDMDVAIPCHVTTNGSIYDDRVERLLQNLPFDFSISIDGVTKETVESIRVNIKYETLMENVRRFNAYVRGRSDRHANKRHPFLELNFCVMRQNWYQLADFFLLAEDMGAKVWAVLVNYPSECSLFSLPPEDFRRILTTLQRQTSMLEGKFGHNKDVWMGLVTELTRHADQARSDLGGGCVNLFDSLTGRTAEKSVLQRGQPSTGSSLDLHTVGSPRRLFGAWQLSAQGRFEEAIREVESIPEHDGYYYHAKCALGEFKIGLGDYDGAERELDEASASARKRPEAHLIRAWLRMTEGRASAALIAAGEATKAEAQLRPVETQFVLEVLVPRLMQDGELASVLALKWPLRPPTQVG